MPQGSRSNACICFPNQCQTIKPNMKSACVIDISKLCLLRPKHCDIKLWPILSILTRTGYIFFTVPNIWTMFGFLVHSLASSPPGHSQQLLSKVRGSLLTSHPILLAMIVGFKYTYLTSVFLHNKSFELSNWNKFYNLPMHYNVPMKLALFLYLKHRILPNEIILIYYVIWQ